MDIDIDALSLKELKDLQSQVVKAIATFEERKKKAALSELEEKAREMGFTLSELTGAIAARRRSPTTEKYRDPDNPKKTWSGRGRKPHWFIAALAAGKSPEDLAI